MSRLNRRSVLTGAVGVAATGLLPVRRARAQGDKPRIACVGVGGKGSSDTDHAGMFGEIVALCDIDRMRLEMKAAKFPEAKKYSDYRKMLEEMAGRIDGVVVSAPDHSHAPAAVMAMRLGKHVYCQKPLTHSVWEARLMREVAREKKVATQMGNQGTADPGFREGVEVIRSGVLGTIREVHTWTNRPGKYWKQAPDVVARPADAPAVPDHVSWDLFLGPAQERPYHPAYHPFAWRGWWDFGTGAMGDMACHTANLAFMALKLGLPTVVSAESSEVNPETYPAWATITYEFPARGDLAPVKLKWYEGTREGERNLPPIDLFHGEKPVDSGSLFVGEKGSLYSPSDYGARQVLLPAASFAEFKPPTPVLERLDPMRRSDENQKWEWVRAMGGGPQALSNFEYAGTLTEAMLLGNIAVRTGKRLEYDGQRGVISNSVEANALIKPQMRAGWSI